MSQVISRKARGALTELLGEYADLGFEIMVGDGCIFLEFKETILHYFQCNNILPVTPEYVQSVCRDYLALLNSQSI